jgi:ribosome-interacting GTPase 1
VLFREDATVDDFIDVIEGNRKYIKCVYVYNKIDVVGIDDVDNLARQPNSLVISCNMQVCLILHVLSIHGTSICSLIICVVYVHAVVTETISCLQLNLDRLLARMWEEMGLVRVYTKPQGQQPDFGDPVVLSTVCFLSCIPCAECCSKK